MNDSTRNPISEIVIGLIITIIGGVIVAWIIREGELFQTKTQSPSPIQISIALTNRNCESLDFFVDGELAVSSIKPNATIVFKTMSGQHWIHTCSELSDNCTNPDKVDWSSSSPTEYSIPLSSTCPIEITLKNNNCYVQDFYVDNQLIVPSIQPEATVVFSITPGQHETYVCTPGTDSCGAKNSLTWSSSTNHSISRASTCPIEITLKNNNCYVQDFYVDNQLIVSSIQPEATVVFSITPGQHETYVCTPGTDSCGTKNSLTWSSSTNHSISRASTCP